MGLYNIESILEHRFPILLIDGIISVDPMQSCHAFKILNLDEWFFSGHFPGNPIMPGSLQIEAFTQAVALPLLIAGDRGHQKPNLVLFAVDRVRFYKQVLPGDKFEIKVRIETIAMGMVSASAVGLVGAEKVSECKIAYKIKDIAT
ncbi:beta-hydroxyacyl-ACP dehydratase [Polynucleobacter paneuropaeus]|jgi:3-hydroxyacyl-[acyl-carrier-protein] dehydratase|nr:beta-hydroxyacyl-ACP dehydratase [Polynucleobacter paneuropaeus]